MEGADVFSYVVGTARFKEEGSRLEGRLEGMVEGRYDGVFDSRPTLIIFAPTESLGPLFARLPFGSADIYLSASFTNKEISTDTAVIKAMNRMADKAMSFFVLGLASVTT